MTPGLLPPLVKVGKGQPAPQPSKCKAFTLHTWSQLPGKTALFDQLAKLKNRKKKQQNCSSSGFCSIEKRPLERPPKASDWLNVEKSVRFTLPPDQVKRSSKNASKSSRVVTFIPPAESEWPLAFDQKRSCWSSHSCRRYRPKPVTSCCCSCYKSEEAFFKRPKSPQTKASLEDLIPDYTEDEEEEVEDGALKSFYPSGSMTLPMKSSQLKKAEKQGQEDLKKATSTNLEIQSGMKKSNESGESDPGYESDSTGSKSKTNVSSEDIEGPKATTLPRRSAAVQKVSLDRRKQDFVQILTPVRLEHRDVAASQTLRAALSKVEAAHPGFSYDLVLGLVRKADAGSNVNMNESLLRLQGAVSDQDCIEYRSSRTEEPFQELNKKSVALKRILARIPEEISDRKTFLETIKEIASAIKKLLDAVNEVSAYIPGTSGKQALDQKKREFVKYSKRFSNTLKEFFRDGQPSPVFTSATYLIYQTNQVMITVKDKCE